MYGLGRTGAAQNSTSTAAAEQGRPPAGPPGRPAPPPGAIDQTNGIVLTVDPPAGDQDTVFVLHGTGWPPGRTVTLTLVGARSAPGGPTVDNGGNFNHAVNQQHEFFSGPIPPGVYAIRAAFGSVTLTVHITVDTAQGPPPSIP